MIFPENKQESKKGAVKEKFPTIINSFSKIAGEISLQTDIRVDGTVYGIVESENNVFIGAEGYVKGIIRAKNLVSFGRIEGTVIILGVSIFHATSSLFGKIFTREISVYAGAYLFGHITTCIDLSPIDEAQINMDEQRTKILSNAIKSDQEILHDFPTDNKINKQIRDTLKIVAIKSAEEDDIKDNTTPAEQKVIDFSNKLTKNEDFILNSKNHIVDLEVIEEIILDKNPEDPQNVSPENALFTTEGSLFEGEIISHDVDQSLNIKDIDIKTELSIEANDIILDSGQEPENEAEISSSEDLKDLVETENDGSNRVVKSFIFDSLLNLSSTEITEKLKIEIEELHKTSGFLDVNEQSKESGSNLFDQLKHKLFNSKK